MDMQQINEMLRKQMKALLVSNPKHINYTIFDNRPDCFISAYVNSFGEAWLSNAPIDDFIADDDSFSTSLYYSRAVKVGEGYDPKGWQQSLLARKVNLDTQSDLERAASFLNKRYDRGISLFNLYRHTPIVFNTYGCNPIK